VLVAVSRHGHREDRTQSLVSVGTHIIQSGLEESATTTTCGWSSEKRPVHCRLFVYCCHGTARKMITPLSSSVN